MYAFNSFMFIRNFVETIMLNPGDMKELTLIARAGNKKQRIEGHIYVRKFWWRKYDHFPDTESVAYTVQLWEGIITVWVPIARQVRQSSNEKTSRM